MLPPGHLAAGFLTAEALLHITKPDLSSAQINQLLWWGVFFSFAPDLDTFTGFVKERAWFVKNPVNNHRKFVSHAPLLWLLAGLLVYFLAADVYWKNVGLLLWLGSGTHFLLDSIEYGIMWLWPFSNKVFALKNRGRERDIPSSTFFGYWWSHVKLYVNSLTFYCEVIVILTALIIYFR